MPLNSDVLFAEFVAKRNKEKILFTPGPAALLEANLTGLQPAFGRGDSTYDAAEKSVLQQILKLSGQRHIVCLQGSATLALSVAINNYLYGRVLVVESGFYSNRLLQITQQAADNCSEIRSITRVPWDSLSDASGDFDWIVSCSTETSMGIQVGLSALRQTADRVNARLLLDATASIGLEPGHFVGDVNCFSSCKGLFGLTGASFICFNDTPTVEVNTFSLDFDTYAQRKTTPPIHSICSLIDVLPNHDLFRHAVVENKNRFMETYSNEVLFPIQVQPILCTRTRTRWTSKDPRVILYTPRSEINGSVICHLGEVHLSTHAQGQILNVIEPE